MVTNRVLVLKFKQGKSIEWICEYHAVSWTRVCDAIRAALK